MGRSNRMFEIIQILRSATAPITASALAATLEITKRTVYRDIVALQSMRVPIEGEAGVGYVMRTGFDLPPLMFTADEIEAIVVGLSLLGRTGDDGLQRAASRVTQKIASVIPDPGEHRLITDSLQVSHWNAIPSSEVDLNLMRKAIREEQKIWLSYQDTDMRHTERTVRPIALVYYVDSIILAAWCELRNEFRHFRADRIRECSECDANFKGQGAQMRESWRELARAGERNTPCSRRKRMSL
jgi:predicted DNA-binding transcriptional regulator YafY